jgi:DNA-binding NarL/FixJ family response regulator
LSRDANLTAQYGKSPQLFAAAVEKNPQAYGRLAANARDIAAVAANGQVFNLIAQNHAALQSLAQNHAALQAAAGGSAVHALPAPRSRGFEELAERAAGVLLTPRELDVLGAISAGLSNKAIARQLGISLHTVKFHIESLFRKLGARTRAEAVAKGLERHAGETVEL